ncbi:MAG: HD domain-containing protein [Bacteroidota bacterium]
MSDIVLPLPQLYIDELKATPQNPMFHAEGNVYNHTVMVLEQFLTHADKFGLDEAEKEVMYWACVLHDIGKPEVTRKVNGRWSSRGHERAGLHIARNILLQHPEISAHQRKRIMDLVKWHQIPLRWGLKGEGLSTYQWLATWTDIRLLAIFFYFDIHGRICVDKEKVCGLANDLIHNIVPKIESSIGTFEEIQQGYNNSCYSKKDALWNTLCNKEYRLLEKILKIDMKEVQPPNGECVITIGPPKAGKTAYVQQHFPEHKYLKMEDFGVNLDQTPEEPLDVVTVKYALSFHMNRQNKLVLDGTNLLATNREKIATFFRESGYAVRYCIFEPSLDAMFQANLTSPNPHTEAQLKEAFELLDFPHPWEAHHLEIIAA